MVINTAPTGYGRIIQKWNKKEEFYRKWFELALDYEKFKFIEKETTTKSRKTKNG